MWKYTHTDEMYHSLTCQNNPETLYHSDTYLGETYDDGLRHFKYIDKKKVNGKWRYYYKDDKLAEKKKIRDAELNVLKYENKKRGYDDGKKAYGYRIYNGKKVNDPTYNKILKDVGYASIDYASEKYDSDKRKKRYNPTVKGLNALSDASYAVGKKVKKAKKAVKNALSKISKNKNKKKK